MSSYLVGLLVAVLWLSACDSVDPAPGTTTSVTTAAGAGELPEEFPAPPDVVDFDQLTISDEEVRVQWETEWSTEEIVDHYEAEFPAAGWQIESRRQGGDSTRYRIEGHGWEGAVIVLGSVDPVQVQLQLGRPDDS